MQFLIDDAAGAKGTFILAHGAGAPMDHPFMNTVATGIAAQGIRVVRFEFPYMAARRQGKRGGAPDRPPVLLDAWREAVRACGETDPTRVVIGGKSLGGRIASMVADELGVAGLVCLGYPFHPPGQPERVRTAHLAELRTEALICQGERDPFGNREDVGGYILSPAIRVEWLPDGDHSFKARARSGASEASNVARAVAVAAEFILWRLT
ncbi:MAG: alpha/beta hydrolase [Acidobacteria bacterium]|nr:alpha/beta hydrolase [Acidobacteriota bacterium]